MAVLVASVGGYVQHRQQQPAATDSAWIGRLAPALTLPDLDGKPHRMGDYRGHRVLLNFWASWCGPCLDEMPALDRAQAKFGEKGAIVVGIAMDEPERIRSFLAMHPVSYPILLGQLGAPSTTLQLGDIHELLPYSVLIDADGRILATHAGALPALQLDRWLAASPRKP
ncbi:TlpA family protein disulfide reductase [Rhodanobacter umsongensis]